jgi:hypothetical protein
MFTFLERTLLIFAESTFPGSGSFMYKKKIKLVVRCSIEIDSSSTNLPSLEVVHFPFSLCVTLIFNFLERTLSIFAESTFPGSGSFLYTKKQAVRCSI